MVENMIQIVDCSSGFMTGWQWPDTLVPIIKLGGKAPKKIRHGDIRFSIAIVRGRVKNAWDNRIVMEFAKPLVTAPQVAVE